MDMMELIKGALNTHRDGIVILDESGKVVFSNKLGDRLQAQGIPENEFNGSAIESGDFVYAFQSVDIQGGRLFLWKDTTEITRIKNVMVMDINTGVFNAQFMKNEIERELDRVHREGQMALVLIDLEMGKVIPEINKIIAVFRNTLRNFDRICKGDRSDYALILYAVDPNRIENIGKRILQALKELEIQKVSVGITLSERSASAEAMIKQAQRALYVVNKRGGNDISIY